MPRQGGSRKAWDGSLRSLRRSLRTLWGRIKEQKLSALLKHAELKLLGSRSSSRAARMPSKVMLEVTGRCNLSCTYCPLDEKEFRASRKGDLDLEKALGIVRGLRGVKVLMLYGLGEPLLYKELETVIREARRRVPLVCFTTNGLLLTPERSRSLAAAGLSRVHVSIDGLDPGYHRRLRGGDLLQVLRNVEDFSRETGLPVHTWSVVSLENVDRLHEMAELKARVPTLEKLHFQLLDGEHLRDRSDLTGRIPAERMRAFKERTLRRCEDLGIETDVGVLPDVPPAGWSPGLCFQPWTGSAYINYLGHVTPCCVMPEVSLDSAVELGFREAWNGPQMRAFRKDLLRGNYLPSCQDQCGFQCNGKNALMDRNVREWNRPSAPPPVVQVEELAAAAAGEER